MAEAIEYLVMASHPVEGFGSLASRLLDWLSCQVIVLQVQVSGPEPPLLQAGWPVTIPGIGVGWRSNGNPHGAALAEGEWLVHDDLNKAFAFGEDASLVRAGLRSAVRGALVVGGREIGRFGLFAEQPGHFKPERVQILREVAPALLWLCRQTAFNTQMVIETEIGGRLDELITAADQGLAEALRACRTQISRMIPAAGLLAMVQLPTTSPAVLIDQVGVAIPGAPESGEPLAWRRWLESLPPEGLIESIAWIFPVPLDGRVVGAIGIAFPQAHENPERWQRRLRPMLNFLSLLVKFERATEQADLTARSHLGALASGLAEEISTLMTELALQADLIQAHLVDRPAARQRSEALYRLVEKATLLSLRLERIAASQQPSDTWVKLSDAIEQVAQYLRTYYGGQHLTIRSRLGEAGDLLVEAGKAEHALTQFLLSLARGQTSAIPVVMRAQPSTIQPGHVQLWLTEEGDQAGWSPADGLAPSANRTLKLELPVRMRS